MATGATGSGPTARVTASSPGRRGAAIIEGKRQAVAPITGAVAAVDNRVGNGQHVRDKGDNHDHNHIEEVIHSTNEYHEFRVISGRLEQTVNRR